MHKLTAKDALRHIGICAGFIWADLAEEHGHDPAEADSAFVIGTLPQEVNGSPVYVVHVDGTADSGFGYSYHTELDLKVSLKEDGEPLVDEASKQDIEEAEQHTRDEACKEYGELARLIRVGAYQERDHEGNYGEDGIEKRAMELERWAIAQGLHFVPSPAGGYVLERASQEEIDTYERAMEESEDEDE